jgi:hypothetical protein
LYRGRQTSIDPRQIHDMMTTTSGQKLKFNNIDG